MTFRAFTEKDAEFLGASRGADFPDCWTEEMIKNSLYGQRFSGLAAEEKGETAAAAFAEICGDTADLECVYTAPPYRGRGLAFSLVLRLCEELKSRGAVKVFLEVRESNAPARALYNKCGFNELNIRKKYYSDGGNAAVMVKEL